MPTHFSSNTFFFQNRFLLGRGAHILRPDHRADGGPPGPLLGGRGDPRRDPLQSRGHPVRGDVRADGSGADFHDFSFRGAM